MQCRARGFSVRGIRDWSVPATAGLRKISRRARKAGAVPDVIFTSPLLRSVQTAEILSERLKHKGAVVVAKELSPGFDLRALRALLGGAGNPMEAAFVGHEPD